MLEDIIEFADVCACGWEWRLGGNQILTADNCQGGKRQRLSKSSFKKGGINIA